MAVSVKRAIYRVWNAVACEGDKRDQGEKREVDVGDKVGNLTSSAPKGTCEFHVTLSLIPTLLPKPEAVDIWVMRMMTVYSSVVTTQSRPDRSYGPQNLPLASPHGPTAPPAFGPPRHQ